MTFEEETVTGYTLYSFLKKGAYYGETVLGCGFWQQFRRPAVIETSEAAYASDHKFSHLSPDDTENVFSWQHQMEVGVCYCFGTYDDDLPLEKWPLLSVDTEVPWWGVTRHCSGCQSISEV